MKNYTIESIMKKKRNVPIYTATGSWNEYSGRYDINTSSILSHLIREAGRLCDNYASDLFYDWKSFEESLEFPDPAENVRLFGLRESGIDGNNYIVSRMNHAPECYSLSHYYRAIYAVEIIIVNDGDMTMNLWKIAL